MLWALTALALSYATLHFAASGVRFPLDHPNLGKFEEEASPLRRHLATGEAVRSGNPEQYGAVFFFIMQPLLESAASDTALANALYVIQLACLIASFLLTCAVLKPSAFRHSDRWPLVVAWLAAIWLNFSPLHTMLALKSVETWELLLISVALYAYLREWRWITAFALASAGLIKVLPFVFFYYLLITDRRTFAYACVALVALLLVGHLMYGPEMGLWYLPRVAAGAMGNSYGLNWHENFSVKAAFAKLFGELPAPTHDGARTSGYLIALTGWRRTAATVVGDASIVAGGAGLTWSWLRERGVHSRDKTLKEWSLLAVALLILSPNTIFEYTTLALGALSYAFVRIALAERRNTGSWALFVASLFLLGGVAPRPLLNRLTMIAALNEWTGNVHLTPSEAYQYYCFPLVGLVLLALTIVRATPANHDWAPASRDIRA
jgi:hypothetical protein